MKSLLFVLEQRVEVHDLDNSNFRLGNLIETVMEELNKFLIISAVQHEVEHYFVAYNHYCDVINCTFDFNGWTNFLYDPVYLVVEYQQAMKVSLL